MLIMLLGAELFAGITYPSYAQEMIQKQSMVFRALSPALLFVSIMCAYRGYLQGMQLMMGTAVSQVVEQVGKLIIGFTLAHGFFPRDRICGHGRAVGGIGFRAYCADRHMAVLQAE